MNKTAIDLHRRVLALIARGVDAATADAEFKELAQAMFAFQFAHNAVYRAYCERLKLTPSVVTHWKEIPAVPTSAFKDFMITSFPAAEAVAEFHTSGTTADKAGKHFFKTLELYDAAIAPNFAAHLLPDNMRLPMLVLTPSPEEAPHSSLAHMMGQVVADFGPSDSGFYMERGALCVERLVSTLREAEQARQPVFLLGTAFAFVHFFEHCEQQDLKFKMADGSRVMETGGFKGRAREMTKPDLYALFERRLGIPPARIVNEYGMTELSTQFDDDTLRRGRTSDLKQQPPWARVLIIDPNTGQEATKGEPGLIRVFDLANLWSAMCIQTEDLGIAHDDGFEILGRGPGAEVRGCSLNAEALRAM
jgi:hypothetical protein